MKKQLLTFILSLSFLFSFSQIANPPSALEACDDITDDGFIQFDLTIVETQVLGSQNPNYFTVSYYETEFEAISGINALPILYTNVTANAQVIYIRLEENATGNYDITTLQLIVNPIPMPTQPTPLALCDDGIPDGLTIFDLSSKNSEITGSNSNYAISFYSSQADSDAGINQLPIIYSNITNPQTVFVRVVDVNTGCNSITTLDLVVEQSPVTNTPQPLRYCDLDNDGFGVFMLTDADNDITGGAAGLTVSYHETYANADNNVDAIDTTVDYNNIVVDEQTLYARVESATIATACATIVELQLIVEPSPQIIEPTPLEECDDVSADGFASFDLTTKADEVLNGADATDYIVSYYETPENANDANNPIANPTAYTNTEPNTQTIWIRVEDSSTAGGCYKITSLVLIVNPLPVLLQPTPLELCDDNYDEVESFDLSVKYQEITAGNDSWSVAYYKTDADAQAQNNAIPNPTQYTNTSVNDLPANPQTLYVTVTDTNTGCVGFTTLTIRVLPIPTPTPSDQIPDLVACDELNTGDGVEVFDLTENELLIMNGEAGQSITYYISESDAFSASNSISDPTQFSNSFSPQTIYARLAIDVTGCFTIVNFNVSEIPCLDADNDGVIDSDEDLNNNGNLEDDDTDGDSLPNYLDNDDDGDGVDTIVEINIVLSRNTIHPFVDTDNDLIENYLDDDDDGDNVLTIDEDYNNNGDPTDDDTNTNSIPDYLESDVALNVSGFDAISFKLFPNPAQSSVSVYFDSNFNQDINISVYDIRGKKIDVPQVTNLDNLVLDTSKLNSGLYFVQLKNTSSVEIERLIIE
ncbi:T9SS type A sorting domain-containing protein [Winogradskyella sp. PG-2]|uniref:T9SS type A sorting domain-containing protein n=1 Tax=Winogradskyella sp. PG-2 TaxID=754409 RepID=UPI0004586171|nr:T9SS type A sorting domain-containing protein [Winogradskyella sp. PG-2]BAO74491.1 hypothetical protein WPG_0261 [Winogradskyella sp. PG-2]